MNNQQIHIGQRVVVISEEHGAVITPITGLERCPGCVRTQLGSAKIGVNCFTIVNDLSLDKVLSPAIMPTETRDTIIAKRQSPYCNSNKGKNMKPYKIYSDSIDPKALNQFFDAMKQEPVVLIYQ